MQDLIVVGAGALAREVWDLVEAINEADVPAWRIVAFAVGKGFAESETLRGVPVYDDWSRLPTQNMSIIIAIGDGKIRLNLAGEFQKFYASNRIEWSSLIHPRALVSPYARIGLGCIVFANSVVSCEAYLKDHVIINFGCCVGHDVMLGDGVTLSPHVVLGGAVHIEEGAFLGLNAGVKPSVRVGSGTSIGMGSAVMRDMPAQVISVGNPARILQSIEAGSER